MTEDLMDHPIFGFDAPEDPERWLFHYTKLETGRLIGSGVRLQLSRLRQTNDPREFKYMEYMWHQTGATAIPRANAEAANDRLNELRLATCVACFTRDSDEGSPRSLARTDARGYARPAMWAHYAERHGGLCLVFDRPELIAASEAAFGSAQVVAQDVSYVDLFNADRWSRIIELDEVGVRGVDLSIGRHFAQFRSELLFEKNADWSGEKEWRLSLLDQPGPDPAYLPLPTGAVTGVVLGVNFDERHFDDIETMCRLLSIPRGNVARLYHHQMNVLDVLPVNTASKPWSFYSRTDLQRLGYL